MRATRNRRRIDQAAVRAAAASFAVRAFKLAGALLGLAAVAAGAAFGASKAKGWLYTSPTFAIDSIRLEGVSRASEDELLRLSGLSIGDNIFAADGLAAEAAMARNPWVRRASVERDYPRRITIRVIEYRPAALADLGGLYFVDESGKAFKKLGPGEEADLPILAGVGRDDYAANREEAEALFREGLEALAAYREAGLEERAPASQVVVDRLAGLTLLCGDDAVAVKLGRGGYAEKFTRLGRLFEELTRRGARAEVIRLDNRTRPGWVAVQLAKGWEGARQ